MAEKKFELKFAASTTGSDQLAKLSRAVEDIGTQSQSTAKLLEKVAQSSIDSSRQIDALAKSAQQLEKALASSVAENSKKFDQLADSAKRLQDAMSKVSGSRSQGFAGIATDAEGATTAVIGLGGAFGTLVAKTGAIKFVADQFLSINRNILETQGQVDKLVNILQVKNDNNLSNTKRDLSELQAVSDRLGLRFTETATAFAKLAVAAKGSALEGRGVREVFEATSGTIAKLGVSADGANRVFLALQQIISKGTVQTEELKGQLGEQIPGAMQIAARAVGVTTAEFAKMLEQGQVISADFLPKFADEMRRTFGISSTESVDTATAALNRFDNSVERLQKSLAEGLSPIAKEVLNSLSKKLDELATEFNEFAQTDQFREYMTNIRFVIQEIGTALQASGQGLSSFIRILSDNKGELKFLAELFVGLRGASVGAAAGGAAFGPVGAAIGAGVGYIGGVSATSTVTDKITGEAELRQRNAVRAEVDKLIASEQRYQKILKDGAGGSTLFYTNALAQVQKDLEGKRKELGALEAQVQNRFLQSAGSGKPAVPPADEEDEFLTTLIAQGRQQAENFKSLEQGYKAQGDAIKGINKDYEIQIKLAKDARAAGLINDAQLKARLAEIEQKYGAKDNSAQKAEEAARAFNNLNDRIQKLAATEAQKIISGDKLNEFLRLSIELTNEANSANSKLTAEKKKEILATAEALKIKGEEIALAEIERDLVEQAAKETEKQGRAIEKTLEAIEKENVTLREKIASVGVSNAQTAEAINLKDEERVAVLEGIVARAKELEQYDLASIAAGKELELLRERIKLRKELGAAQDAQEVVQRQERMFTQLYRELTRGISDSIFRGFEQGKKFITVFKDAIKNAFKTFTIRVAIQPVIGSVIAGVAGSLGFSGLAKAAQTELGAFGGSGSDLLGGAAGAKSVYDLANGALFEFNAGLMRAVYGLAEFAGASAEQAAQIANLAPEVAGALGYLAAAKNVFDVSSGGRVGAAVGAGVGAFLTGGSGVGAAIGSTLGKLADELVGLSKALGIEAKVSARALPQEVLTGISDSISKGFTDTVEKLGGTGSLGAVTVTGNTGRQSQNPNISVAAGGYSSAARFAGDGLFLRGEIALNEQNLTEEITRAIFAGLQSSDFADNIDALFDSLDPVTASLEDLTRALGVAEQLVVLNEVFGEFGNNLKALSGASVETIRQFTAAVGGLKNLDGLLRNFNSKFLSAGEQSDLFVAQLTKQFENLSLSLPKTRAEFRSLVESQDLLTESGARTYAALLGLTDGVDTLFSAAEQANQAAIESANAALDAANQAVSDAQSALQQAIDAERDRLQIVIDAEEQAREAVRQAYESQRGELDATISKFRDFSSSIRTLRRELSNRAFGGTVGSARSVFNDTISRALGGDEAAFGELGGAANNLLDTLRDSAPDYLTFVRGFADVQRQLLEVEGFADSTASVAERQLSELQQQVSQFIELNKQVASVDESIKALKEASTQADAARVRMIELDNLQLSMLGTINGSVLTVAQAVAALNGARAQQGAAQNSANIAAGNFGAVTNDADVQLVQKLYQDIGGRAADPAGLAFYVGQLKSGGKTPQEVVADLVYAKQTLGSKFATGGAFSNGIVTRATQFPMGLMGEAGPEAIMPLTRAPDGSLGVRAAGGQSNAEMVAELRQLREEVSMLRAEARASAVNTGKTADILNRATDGGQDYIQTKVAV